MIQARNMQTQRLMYRKCKVYNIYTSIVSEMLIPVLVSVSQIILVNHY